MSAILVRVLGLPAPQGSKRAFVRGGRAMLVESSAKVAPWRQDVKVATALVMGDAPPLDCPLRLAITFLFPRPKGHMGRHGVLPSAPLAHTVRPDLDKLTRSTLDALTGVLFRDDSQVCALTVSKVWCNVERDRPGAIIEAYRVEADTHPGTQAA